MEIGWNCTDRYRCEQCDVLHSAYVKYVYLNLMCFLNMYFSVPISVVLWVTGQAMEWKVNPALNRAGSQMKCLIAKVHRSQPMEPEVPSVVKSPQFMPCICLFCPGVWCACHWLGISASPSNSKHFHLSRFITACVFYFSSSGSLCSEYFVALLFHYCCEGGEDAGWTLPASLE